jgi:hypothetical protein
MYNTGEARQEVVGEARRDEVWTNMRSYVVDKGKIDSRNGLSTMVACGYHQEGKLSLMYNISDI